MSIATSLVFEFDYEMANTRKTLERVPDSKLGWKPHEKSGTMGWLATHISVLPYWAFKTLTTDHLDVAVEELKMPAGGLPTTAEVVQQFHGYTREARAALESATDERMMQPWRLHAGERTFFEMPRVAVLRGFVLSHLIHHRGQLTVYLRLNDVAVPALYGPSADENPF